MSIDMDFYLLNSSHSHLFTPGAFEQVRLMALRHYWIPNSITLHEPTDPSDHALKFSLDQSYLYLPWNVDALPIQCHISCQQLADNGYAWTLRMLDRILRLLCDHCPGLFQLEYKNGLFGRQFNRLIIYNGLANLYPNEYDHWKQRVQLQMDRLSSTRTISTLLADLGERSDEHDCGLRSIRYRTLGHGRIRDEAHYDWYV